MEGSSYGRERVHEDPESTEKGPRQRLTCTGVRVESVLLMAPVFTIETDVRSSASRQDGGTGGPAHQQHFGIHPRTTVPNGSSGVQGEDCETWVRSKAERSHLRRQALHPGS